jgi:hypothetical protein
MASHSHPTLVASPDFSFREISAKLTELGWDTESSSADPILRGEPEVATFVQLEDRTQIYYTFNPAVKLRVMQFRGLYADLCCQRVAFDVPVLSSVDVTGLLDSGDRRRILLGLFAAEELGEIEALPRVAKLCLYDDPKIARTALRVREALLPKTLDAVSTHLAAEQARRPDRFIWFSQLAKPELRRQVLRWLIRDRSGVSNGVHQILLSALDDLDPEVRITAVLTAAKVKATNLIQAICKADMPTSTSLGAFEPDRLLYERLRQTTARYLSTGVNDEFQKALDGAFEVRDDATLLFYSLITPVDVADKPAHIPQGIEERGGDLFITGTNICLRWVAPIPHWLGHGTARSVQPGNPIKRVTPERGFFIAERPLNCEQAAVAPEDVPYVCSFEEAEGLCERLRASSGLFFRLPTAEQWEMAARGPDGRRYSWGNSLAEDGPSQPSPWMVKNTVSPNGEWTGDRDDGGLHIVCGGKMRACAAREAVPFDDDQVRCAVRPTLSK